MTVQPDLFPPPTQPRRKRLESTRYYGAVMMLRRQGVRVIRAGRWMALVNGKLVTAADVIRLAAARAAEVITL